jgi:hypothetical protein
MRVADVMHAISPDVAMGVARRNGAYRYIEKMAARADEAEGK